MNDKIGIIIVSIFVYIGVYLLTLTVPELNAFFISGFITGLFIILAFITKRRDDP